MLFDQILSLSDCRRMESYLFMKRVAVFMPMKYDKTPTSGMISASDISGVTGWSALYGYVIRGNFYDVKIIFVNLFPIFFVEHLQSPFML